MRIRNGVVLMDDWQLRRAELVIRDTDIDAILPSSGTGEPDPANDPLLQAQPDPQLRLTAADDRDEPILDARGLYVLPGLVDLHTHGCAGYDFSDNDAAAVDAMMSFQARQGVTSFLGTTMTLPAAELEQIVRQGGRASFRGIYLEGPFFNKSRKGAHQEQYLIQPDPDLIERLQTASGHSIRVLAIAPELPGALEMIEKQAGRLTVSLAHTTADYDTAMAAFNAGASQLTHVFNAMPGLHHREPGVIGAAIDAQASVELICDGFHVHPAMVRAVFKLFGAERVILISDSMRASGLENGTYDLGGQTVYLMDGKATLADGTLAGSAASLLQCLQRAASFGIPLPDAVRAATANPAKAARIDQKVGSLTPGKQADLILLDKDLVLKYSIVAGKIVQEA